MIVLIKFNLKVEWDEIKCFSANRYFGLFSSLAMADSFNLENPDGLRYQLKYGETVVKEGKDTRFYDSRNPVVPQKNISISVEDENGTNIAEKSVPSSLNGNSRGCNYSMIVTSHHGWRITGNCIETEGNYKPDAPHIYTVENNSKKKVYPAFQWIRPITFLQILSWDI